jgi:glycine oxidase
MYRERNKRTSSDVVIIGGGVIGCAIAYYLCKRQVTVTVLEKGEIGAQASGAAAGLLAPLGPLSGPGPLADLVLAAFAAFPALVAELEEATGLHLGYEQTGALRTVLTPKRLPHLHKRWGRWQTFGLRLSWLTGEDAYRQEPLLTPNIVAAIYAPEEAQVDALHLTQAFAKAAGTLGAQILPYHEVVGCTTQGGRVVNVRTRQGETFDCGSLLIASGAWAQETCSWLHASLPITPLHGQLLALPQPACTLRSMVFGEGIYLVPRGSSIIVGATKEERGFDLEIDRRGTSWLLETAQRLVPQLSNSQPSVIWTGLRPRTPDTRPIFGFLPGWQNVVLAAGHNSIGILLSGMTGQALTDLLTTGQLPPLAQPFSLDRLYIGKDLAR